MDLTPDVCFRIFASRDARFDGRVFVGVKTTGIYCRPICPARTPKPENVSFYPSAAAACQAGFRPCLRCRPELAPDLAGWDGTSTTVARALGLIEAGALDDGDVESLAGHLGITGRQLRRLFNQHLGATPVAVAQTRRIHLAKQLLHETNLGMAEVAFAAGFGSVRRFNETFQTLFREPPALLRRARGAASGTGAGAGAGGITIRLPYQPPYDWDGLLEYLGGRLIPGVETVRDGRYARTIALDGQAGTLAVEPGPKQTLQATVRFPRLVALPRTIARLRRVFDLAANPELINAHLAADPFLAPLVAARPGLRVPGAWDDFELAVRAILGQQITVALATRQSGLIVAAFGPPLDDPHANALGLTHLFPTPAQLAAADLADLGLMPGARARAISALGAAVAADPGLFGPYRDLPSTVARLKSLPGIGEWTAQYIALRALREADAFPAADVGLMRAIAPELGRRPSSAELLLRAEAWRPWRAYAALHLWTSLTAPAVLNETTHDQHAA